MSDTSTVSIALVPALNGWRAVIYVDGKAVKMGPASHDRDVALLYARAAEDLLKRHAEAHR